MASYLLTWVCDFFFFFSLQIDTTHFVLVIRPFVRVPVEAGANMALLQGELCWMDNVTDHGLEKGGWWGVVVKRRHR